MLSLPIYEHNMPLHLSLIYFISIMSFSAYIWCACFIRLILFIFENESIWYHVFYFSFLIFDASIDNVLWSTHMISLHYNILWQQNLFILWCSCNSIIFSFLRHLLKHLINGYRGDKRERQSNVNLPDNFLIWKWVVTGQDTDTNWTGRLIWTSSVSISPFQICITEE